MWPGRRSAEPHRVGLREVQRLLGRAKPFGGTPSLVVRPQRLHREGHAGPIRDCGASARVDVIGCSLEALHDVAKRLEVLDAKRRGHAQQLSSIAARLMPEALGACNDCPQAALDVTLRGHGQTACGVRRPQRVPVLLEQPPQNFRRFAGSLVAAEQPLDHPEELLVVAPFAERVIEITAVESVRRCRQEQYRGTARAGTHHLARDVGTAVLAGQKVLEALELVEDHQIRGELAESRLRKRDSQQPDGVERVFLGSPPQLGWQVLARREPELLAKNGEERPSE